jgi:hypothetical protein
MRSAGGVLIESGGGAVTPYDVGSPRSHGLLCRMSSNLLHNGTKVALS